MEYWSVGVLERWAAVPYPSLQHSITPILLFLAIHQALAPTGQREFHNY